MTSPSGIALNHSLPPGPKLNLGCGPVQPSGWINVDGSNRARLAAKLPWVDRMLSAAGIIPRTEFGPHIEVLDLLKPLPYKDNSVACIYSGEVWEHFEYPDAIRLTRECYRVLAPNGVLRLCVPDGPEFWRNYLKLFDSEYALPRDKRRAERLREVVQMYFREICTKRSWFGSMGHTHKWQWDEIQLVEAFESQGFRDVERMPFHQSRIGDLSGLERSNFLIVEGVKRA
jgi:predicted SAM-dependent methyltransferase